MYVSVFNWVTLIDVPLILFIKGFYLWTNDGWVCSSFLTLFFLTDRYEVFCSAFQQVNIRMVVFRHDFRLWNTYAASLDILIIFYSSRSKNVQLFSLARTNMSNPFNRSSLSFISSEVSIFFNILYRSFSFPIYAYNRSICQWYRLKSTD